MLWYCGAWVWRGFEPRERPVRLATIKGLTLDSIVPHAPIDSLTFSVFAHARILTLGMYGPESEAAYFTSASVYSMPRRDLLCLWGASRLSCVGSSGRVRRWCTCSRWDMCFILWPRFCCLRDETSACPGMEVVGSRLCLARFYGVVFE